MYRLRCLDQPLELGRAQVAVPPVESLLVCLHQVEAAAPLKPQRFLLRVDYAAVGLSNS